MMEMKRRDFIGTALAAGVAASTGPLSAQQAPAPRGGGSGAAAGAGGRGNPPPKTSTAKVEKLWNIPSYKNMNALEAAPDGLWIGDQVSEKVCRVDWQTGKILYEVQTESHNMSGLGVGGGYLWAGSNGSVNNRRPPRPTDREYGEYSQLDMKTGKIVKLYRPPWGGGAHGVTFNLETGKLWVAALDLQAVAEMDPKDNLRILRMFRTPGQRQHGLDIDKDTLYVLYATDREVHKFDISKDAARLLEVIQIPKTEPDQHGLALHDGYLYYCDSGLTDPGPGSMPGQICRFKLNSGPATN
jgi:streptogramin lyase